MKKLVSIIIILAISLTFTSSLADIDDVSSLNDNELYELWIKVNEEIESRYGSPIEILYQGSYVTGVDIAPGRYVVSFYKDDAYVNLYESLAVYSETLKWMSHNRVDENDEHVFELSGDMVISITHAPCLIRKVDPFAFRP